MAIDDAQLARPYAEAAHKHAVANNNAAAWSELLRALSAALNQAELKHVLADPRLSPEQGTAVLTDVLDKIGNKDAAMYSFVGELGAQDRLGVSAEIAKQYEQLRRNAEGVLEAEIRSAFELDKQRVEAIAAKLKEKFNATTVTTKVVIDESLGGGVVIIAGDDVIDCTVAAELNQLRNSLRR